MSDTNLVPLHRGKTLNKIKRLKQYKKEYTDIRGIKQKYLNSLQRYNTYHTINIECHRIQQEVRTLDSQLSDMDGKLLMLKKELE